MGVQGVEDETEDATLWNASVCNNAGFSPVANPDGLGPASQSPVASHKQQTLKIMGCER